MSRGAGGSRAATQHQTEQSVSHLATWSVSQTIVQSIKHHPVTYVFTVTQLKNIEC